jgi:hypothetical protein
MSTVARFRHLNMSLDSHDKGFSPDNSRPSIIYPVNDIYTMVDGPKIYVNPRTRPHTFITTITTHMPCQSVFQNWYNLFLISKYQVPRGLMARCRLRESTTLFPRQASQGLDRTSSRAPICPQARPLLLVSLANDGTMHCMGKGNLHWALQFHCPDSWHDDRSD